MTKNFAHRGFSGKYPENTVSYTHLDVYKRQVVRSFGEIPIGLTLAAKLVI